MLTNRPRGISLNKNAVNIKAAPLNQQQPNQLHHSPDEPLPPKLKFNLTRAGPLVAQQENLIQIDEDPKQQSDDLKKADLKSALLGAQSKELFQLTQSQFLIEATKATTNTTNTATNHLQSLKSAPQLQPLQPVQPLQLHQQQQPLKIQLPTTKSATNQQQLLQQQQQLLQQQNESLVSRIPRLSLRFPVLPLASNKTATSTANNQKANLLPTMTELEDAMSVSAASSEDEEIEDIDNSPTSRDAIFQVSEIAQDIYEYMYDLEKQQAIRQDYLKEQKILTPKVRQRLVNWCIDIHSQLRLLPETLYTTIMVIDRYFDQVTVKQQSQVQLVAVGATLIASKYEEIYPPDMNDLIHLTQNQYKRRDIMRIEIQILEQLDFNLGKPIPLAFLRRFSKAAHCDLKMHSIAKYLMELSLNEYECCHWHPSLLAAASLFATLHLVHQGGGVGGSGDKCSLIKTSSSSLLSEGSLARRLATSRSTTSQSLPQDRWNKTLVHYTHYTKAMLLGPAGTLCKILKRSQKNPQSYTCVKKNLPNLSKWLELKTTRVDDLIKLGGQSSM